MNINRTLGNGFGKDNHFNLFTQEEIYKPLINITAFQRIDEVRQWALAPVQEGPITDVVEREELAKVLPDLLANGLDITRLIKVLPGINAKLSDQQKELFSKESVWMKLDPRFLRSVGNAVSSPPPQTISEWARLLSKDNIVRLDPRVLAYLIPALLNRMEGQDLAELSSEIAKGLAPKDFRAINMQEYFNLRFTPDHPQMIRLINNGRSLIFKAVEPNIGPRVFFQGKEWFLDHVHIHFEKMPHEDREYKFYETRAQYQASVQQPEKDPNRKIVGEVHIVYKRKAGKDKTKSKSMAVAFPLIFGKANENFQLILDHSINQHVVVNGSMDVRIPILFQKTFMREFSNDEVLYHSWGSLKAKAHDFVAGLRFNIINKPIEISEEQYDQLHHIFGDLQELNPGDELDPIDRGADYRQPK